MVEDHAQGAVSETAFRHKRMIILQTSGGTSGTPFGFSHSIVFTDSINGCMKPHPLSEWIIGFVRTLNPVLSEHHAVVLGAKGSRPFTHPN